MTAPNDDHVTVMVPRRLVEEWDRIEADCRRLAETNPSGWALAHEDRVDIAMNLANEVSVAARGAR